MAFNSSLKFLAKFSSTPLIDEVSANALTVSGTGSAALLDGGLGYQMAEQQHVELADISLGIGDKATIGFWLKSVNPGVVRNPISDDLQALMMSVLDIRNIHNDLIFTIWEETQEDGINNVLKIDITGGSTITATSKKYLINTWHHFWIVYDGSSSVKIFIDGVDNGTSTSGTLPVSVSGSNGHISINRQALGSAFDVADNTGQIDEVLVLNSAITSTDTLKKVINVSADYAFDTSYLNNEEVDQGFLFNDPDVFRLTSLVDDGSSVFMTRSDGKVLEGLPTFWQAKRNFRNQEDVESLDIFGAGFSAQDGYLEISGSALAKL